MLLDSGYMSLIFNLKSRITRHSLIRVPKEEKLWLRWRHCSCLWLCCVDVRIVVQKQEVMVAALTGICRPVRVTMTTTGARNRRTDVPSATTAAIRPRSKERRKKGLCTSVSLCFSNSESRDVTRVLSPDGFDTVF